MRNETIKKVDHNTIEHSSWLTSWPYGSRVLSDEMFVFAIHFRLGLLSPMIQKCRNNHQIILKDEEQSFDHVNSCVHCGGIFNHLRHEFINNELSKVFSFYAIPHTLNPTDFPLPLNERGGPDFILYLGTNIIAGDVTVTRNKTANAYARKMRVYNTFASQTGFSIFPLSVSYTGIIARDSLQSLRGIARDLHRPSFLHEAVDVIQFALIKGLFTALKASHARTNLMALSPSLTSPFNASQVNNAESQSNSQSQNVCEESEA